ncbi:unnamed protein product, partial [Brassica napus]
DTSGNAELQDDEWDESTVHEFYKRPMPKWFSDEAFALDSKKYYVVPESELHDNDLLQLLMEVAFYSKSDRCLDAYLPLEVKNVVVETFEDEPRDKLMANNAIFYLSYKCCADPCSTSLADRNQVTQHVFLMHTSFKISSQNIEYMPPEFSRVGYQTLQSHVLPILITRLLSRDERCRISPLKQSIFFVKKSCYFRTHSHPI